jgi:hypothetical protein
MNFTYHKEDEVIIMTTRKDTLKLRNLLESSSVAILVHDYPQMRTDRENDTTASDSNSGRCTYRLYNGSGVTYFCLEANQLFRIGFTFTAGQKRVASL